MSGKLLDLPLRQFGILTFHFDLAWVSVHCQCFCASVFSKPGVMNIPYYGIPHAIIWVLLVIGPLAALRGTCIIYSMFSEGDEMK
jgi:hypothetical protein